MLLITLNYVPGKEIEALGIVKGTTVQTKNFGKDFMSGMKTLVGGELSAYTEMLNEARQIATKRMVDEAKTLRNLIQGQSALFQEKEQKRREIMAILH